MRFFLLSTFISHHMVGHFFDHMDPRVSDLPCKLIPNKTLLAKLLKVAHRLDQNIQQGA